MIRRIEVRKLGDEVFYFEHAKPTLRHKKMLCGLKPPHATFVGYDGGWNHNPVKPCQICRNKSPADYTFLHEYRDNNFQL